jgi:hypothetical protein
MGNLPRQLVLGKSVLLASFRYRARLVDDKKISPRMTAHLGYQPSPRFDHLGRVGTIYPQTEKHRNGRIAAFPVGGGTAQPSLNPKRYPEPCQAYMGIHWLVK